MARYILILAQAFLLGGITACQQVPSVRFDIDARRDVKPISRYIYGINQFHGVVDGLEGPYSNLTFTRLGGNRFTAYNWTNNASNAGSDYFFHNDDYLVDGDLFKGIQLVPGGAVIPTLDVGYRHNAAVLLTIPINGYVAADKLAHASVRDSGANYLQTRFKPERPRKNAAFTLTPDPNAPLVYQDEFVNWVKTKCPYAQTDLDRPIWFSMDNEPAWWTQAHLEVHPQPVTYAELVGQTIAYASAVKDVMGSTLIFGPANYGWFGYVALQGAPDGGGRDFHEYYLQRMAEAEKSFGRRLLDVLDVHWYPEAQGGGVRIMGSHTTTAPSVSAARMQAPRSLWDPTYSEVSWITEKSIGAPIRLIPRLKDKIDKCYPGTKLAISEYYFGAGNDISGGIAQADALGIFGREGLFAAAIWPDENKMPFVDGAFQMYRDFDGKNGTFGDISVRAQTGDIEKCSVYASLDSRNGGRMIVVLINKTNRPLQANMRFHNADRFDRADVYQLTSARPVPQPAGIVKIDGRHCLDYVMPAFSVTTLQLGDGS